MKDNAQNQEMISLEDMGSYLFDDYKKEDNKEEAPDKEDDSFSLIAEEPEEGEPQTNTTPKAPTEPQAEDKQEEEVKKDLEPNMLTSMVKSFIKDGSWDDFSIEHEGTEYDSLADLVDNIEVTEEVFKGLLSTQNEGYKKKLEDRAVILKDNIDPTRAEIVKAIASGVKDYQPLVDSYDNVIEPLKNLDLSEEQNSIGLIAKFYKEVNKWDDDYIGYKIEQHKKDLNLDDTAEDIRKDYINSFQQIVEEKKKESQELEKEQKTKEKESKKQFKDTLKSKEYSDPFISKALNLMYTKDNGESHWEREIKTKINEDEDFKIDFAHWLLDREDYINKKMAPKKREEKLKSVSLINILGQAKKKNNNNNKQEKEEESDMLDITVS